MFLKRLSVLNYKNIRTKELEFSPRINCLVGDNGVGKTNFLDAIYHLGMGKSYFNSVAIQNITHGEDFYMLEGFFIKEQREDIVICSMKKGQKKIIKLNGKIHERLADHVGNFPVVIVSPSDRDLITEGSEERRRFLDGVISQANSSYLSALLNYNKILLQRNSLLKHFADNQVFESIVLAIYNEQLSLYGEMIYQQRAEFLNYFLPIFEHQYQIISGGKEKVEVIYETKLHQERLSKLLIDNELKDRKVQYTTQGIHKDDLLFLINGYSVKKFASQGQQKSFLTALRFAQFQVIKQQTGKTPILLLDDIFDKLDANRVEQIVTLVSSESFGQIFVSDTDVKRTEEIVKSVFTDYKIIYI